MPTSQFILQLNRAFTAHLPLSEVSKLRVRLLRAVESRPAARAVVRPERKGNAVADEQGHPRELHEHPPKRDPGHEHP